jgi:hypothetical protein
MGLTVSCDLNYRAKLWKWGKPAGEVMAELLGFCDVAIGNQEDADRVFGIKAPEADITTARVEAASYRHVCQELALRFLNLRTVATTLRGSLSTSHNTWSGALWDGEELYACGGGEGHGRRCVGEGVPLAACPLPILDIRGILNRVEVSCQRLRSEESKQIEVPCHPRQGGAIRTTSENRFPYMLVSISTHRRGESQ